MYRGRVLPLRSPSTGRPGSRRHTITDLDVSELAIAGISSLTYVVPSSDVPTLASRIHPVRGLA